MMSKHKEITPKKVKKNSDNLINFIDNMSRKDFRRFLKQFEIYVKNNKR